MQRRWLTLLLSLPILVILISIVGNLAGRKNEKQSTKIVIFTGSKGGTYFEVGKGLRGVLSSRSDQSFESVEIVRTQGASDNLNKVIHETQDNGIGFVMKPALKNTKDAKILAKLYADVIQIVVNDNKIDQAVNTLGDLRGLKIFVGLQNSGTRLVANNILSSIGFVESDIERDSESNSFNEAATSLASPETDLQAAIFVSGTPLPDLQKHFQEEGNSLRLISISESERQLISRQNAAGTFRKSSIKPYTYPYQAAGVESLETDVFLICNAKMESKLAYAVLDSLFDKILELLYSHTRVQDIRMLNAFPAFGDEAWRDYHKGAAEFAAHEKKKLLIATGTAKGKYYRLGKTLESLLEMEKIPARCIHTDGSLENLKLLLNQNEQPTIAIVQSDVALAARKGMENSVYGVELAWPAVIGEDNVKPNTIRKLAALHEESLYAVFPKGEGFETLFNGPKRKVCVGPELSGARLIAESVLTKEFLFRMPSKTPDEIGDFVDIVYLNPMEMVAQLRSKKIHAGFFVSGEPSSLFKSLLDNDSLQLSPMSIETQSELVEGPAFESTNIDQKTHRSSNDPDGVRSLKTHAVLITTDNFDGPYDLERITTTAILGRSYLQVNESNAEKMANAVPMLPLHNKAIKAYQQHTNWLPASKKWGWIEWLTFAGKLVATTVFVFAGFKSSLLLRRDKVSNEIGRRILAVELGNNEPNSVLKLHALQEELNWRVQLRWWNFGEIDKSRWQRNTELIEQRTRLAKDNLTLDIVGEIVQFSRDDTLSHPAKTEAANQIKSKTLHYIKDNEIDNDQRQLIVELIADVMYAEDTQVEGANLQLLELQKFVLEQNKYLADRPRALVKVALRKTKNKLKELGLQKAVSAKSAGRKIYLQQSV